jgi:hypothetical protein
MIYCCIYFKISKNQSCGPISSYHGGTSCKFCYSKCQKTKITFFKDNYILIILTRRHGNFVGVHTLLRILLSSNSAVLINIITGVSPPHFYYYTYFVCICYFFLTSQHFEYEFIINFLYKQALMN